MEKQQEIEKTKRNQYDSTARMRYYYSRKEVVKAYKLFLDGVPLDELKVSDNIKNIIREFERYSTFTAYQIGQMSEVVDSDTAAVLRRVKKMYRREQFVQKDEQVEQVVKKKLEHISDKNLQRSGIHANALHRGKTIIKMAKAGKSASEIAKAIDFGECRVKKILENVKIEVKA